MQLVFVSIQLVSFFSVLVESLSHGASQGASKAVSNGHGESFPTEYLILMDMVYRHDESNNQHILDFSPWFTAKCVYDQGRNSVSILNNLNRWKMGKN